jgi:DNA-binding MarR family transcriptional regulator
MDSMARIGLMHHKQGSEPKDLPTQAQIGVLFVLSHQGSQSIKDLSLRFGMTSSAATQLVDGLVKHGFLKRMEDRNDRRKMCVDLTSKGKKTLEKAKKQRIEKMAKMFEPLTDEELMQLQKIQSKIVEHWEHHARK